MERRLAPYCSINRLTSVTGSKAYSFGYDAYGNVTNNNHDSFIYDDASSLISLGSQNIDYLYDGHNRRARVQEFGETRHSMYSSNGVLLFEHEPTSTSSTNNTSYYYLSGDMIARADSSVNLDTDQDNDGVSDGVEVFYGASINSSDSDGDGIPDAFEITYGLDPTIDDALWDDDSDGLTNLEEFQIGSDPNNSDTDGDGTPDGLDSTPTLNVAAILIPIFHILLN